MKYEELVELLNQVDQSSLAYVDFETDSHHVVISKEVPQMAAPKETAEVVTQQVDTSVVNEVQVAEMEEAPAEKEGELVESPMVGVVYLQPTPDEDTFVKVGDHVNQGDVICIVEAMKLMNEIQAPCSGVVTEILVQNEEVVEYSQPLVRIEG